MVIFVTKTSCLRREMTSLAPTVCAHIAATLYTPRFCAFEYRFLPFPNLTPNPPSNLPYTSLVMEGMERGMGMATGAMSYASLVVEVMERGMGMALEGVPIASRVAGVMGKGVGMDPAGVPIASRVVEVMGRGMGMAPVGVPIASLVVEVMEAGVGMASGGMPYASPLVGVMGDIMRWSSAVPRSIHPKACSYFSTFSCNAMSRRLACSGAIIILLATSGLGMPGNACAKSITKSLCEWLINTRLA